MATLSDEVRVPLLASRDSTLLDDFQDDLEIRYPLQGAKREVYRPHRAGDGDKDSQLLSLHLGNNTGGLRRVGSELAAASGSRKKKQYSGSEMIVAVFVVAFDTKKGEPLISLLT